MMMLKAGYRASSFVRLSLRIEARQSGSSRLRSSVRATLATLNSSSSARA